MPTPSRCKRPSTVSPPDVRSPAAPIRHVEHVMGTVVSFEWIPRLENARADRLANEAMDKRMSFER